MPYNPGLFELEKDLHTHTMYLAAKTKMITDPGIPGEHDPARCFRSSNTSN